MKKLYPTIAAFSLALSALALPTIQIDRVAQRWPWNNKVDITYTISGEGGQSVKESQYCKVKFVATVGGETYTIDGASDIIAWADNGTHTVTWTNAPAGVRISNCEMRAQLYRTDGYYMVVDLDTGAYAFDDLADGDTPTATPTFSNARYNTPLYKTDRMVLRRVPRTSLADSSYSGGYPTGDDKNYASSNGRTNWVTDADYFIGVFEVTRGQLMKLGMTDSSANATYPANNIYLYGNNSDGSYQNPSIGTKGVVSSTTPCFFPRLNARTGIKNATGTGGFYLPTEIMWEIACRAGATTVYPWSDASTALFTYSHGNCSALHAVGEKASNAWGLYDMVGNVSEMCPGTKTTTDLKQVSSPWATPNHLAYAKCRGGSAWHNTYQASNRGQDLDGWNKDQSQGFRVSIVLK